MNTKTAQFTLCSIACSFFIISTSNAAPVQIDMTASIVDVSDSYIDGTYASNLTTGLSINGTFIFDTDEANASVAETTPGTNPGHEFTSFYDFSGSPYAVSISSGGFSFTNTAPVSIVVNDNLDLTSAETNGQVSDGNYDWIEILGSTTSDVAGPHTPGNGQEWTLALIANDNNWFTDGSVIPDNLPSAYTPLLIGLDFDSTGAEVGFAFATIDTLTVTSAPIPAAAWLFGSGLIGLVGLARRKQAT